MKKIIILALAIGIPTSIWASKSGMHSETHSGPKASDHGGAKPGEHETMKQRQQREAKELEQKHKNEIDEHNKRSQEANQRKATTKSEINQKQKDIRSAQDNVTPMINRQSIERTQLEEKHATESKAATQADLANIPTSTPNAAPEPKIQETQAETPAPAAQEPKAEKPASAADKTSIADKALKARKELAPKVKSVLDTIKDILFKVPDSVKKFDTAMGSVHDVFKNDDFKQLSTEKKQQVVDRLMIREEKIFKELSKDPAKNKEIIDHLQKEYETLATVANTEEISLPESYEKFISSSGSSTLKNWDALKGSEENKKDFIKETLTKLADQYDAMDTIRNSSEEFQKKQERLSKFRENVKKIMTEIDGQGIQYEQPTFEKINDRNEVLDPKAPRELFRLIELYKPKGK